MAAFKAQGGFSGGPEAMRLWGEIQAAVRSEAQRPAG
jgi:hypothetical protein